MPFVPLTMSDAFASRVGTTGITGSLNPSVDDGIFNVGASIGAGPPFGIITTTTSWGFSAGLAPPGAMSLIVTADGVTAEAAETFTIGGYAEAQAGISVTIEEFGLVERDPDRPVVAGGTVRLPREDLAVARLRDAQLVRGRSFTSATTPFIHIWSAGLGLQFHDRKAPFSPLMVMPPIPGFFYRCWFNVIQSATCQAATGPGGASCRFVLGMRTAFFAFS